MTDRESYDPDCTRCPRLSGFLADIRQRYPQYWARPVPSFGAADPAILIVGLAPGLHGANRTSRPFTGDFAGILLYETLHELGLATGRVSLAADDGLELVRTRITNAVKCVPPENKPRPDEIRRCNGYLRTEVARLASVRVYVALGRIAHEATLLALSLRPRAYPFAHGREHTLEGARMLIDSYHCSRYNTQTRRLTPAMFKKVIARAHELAFGTSGPSGPSRAVGSS
jgi:uracil-DNA glycosylase family 4